MSPKENTLLIADPFLKDPNFMRSVIFLCSHGNEGSFGLKLNERFNHTLNEIISGLEGFPLPVYVGGPVGLDTLHFLHQYPDQIPDSQRIADDVWWGGNFDVVKNLITSQNIDIRKIRFFVGYSGWSEGQLEHELNEKSWLVEDAISTLIFNVSADEVWKESIRLLDTQYHQLIHYPIDPQLN